MADSKSSTPSLAMAASSATMTSVEIAELTGKQHAHVMRDIRAMLGELHGEGGVSNFGDTQTNPQNKQSYPIYRLPKRETLILVSGYSTAMRAKIIDRWQELEAAAAPAALDLRDIRQLAPFALQLIGVVQEQHAQLEAQAPKVRFAEAVGDAETLQKPKVVANVLGEGLVTFYARLREWAVLQADNRPYQKHIDAGRFRMIEEPYTDKVTGEKRVRAALRITGRGVTYCQQLFAKAQEVSHG